MELTLESGQTWHGTIVNRHRDGHLIEQETTISPLRDAGGAITHYVAVKRDVTIARAQARALAESEARYRAVVDAQTEFIIRVDGQGNWTFMNEAAERFVGMTFEEIRAKGFRDLEFVLKDDWPVYKAHVARITPEHPTDTVELRGRLPDGTVHWEQWTDTGIFDAEGKLHRDAVHRAGDHRPQARRGGARRGGAAAAGRAGGGARLLYRHRRGRARWWSSTPPPSGPSAIRGPRRSAGRWPSW